MVTACVTVCVLLMALITNTESACQKAGEKCHRARGTCDQNRQCVCDPGYHLYDNFCMKESFFPQGTNKSRACPFNRKCGGFGRCDDDLKCVCPKDFMPLAETLCVTNLFHPVNGCSKYQPCGDGNGLCVDQNWCQCHSSFYVQGNTCAPVVFKLDSCQTAGSVCGGGNGQCAEDDKVCICRAGFFASQEKCVAGDGLEFSDETCPNEDASCQNGVCMSKMGDGQYQCMCHPGYKNDTESRSGGTAECVEVIGEIMIKMASAAESPVESGMSSFWLTLTVTFGLTVAIHAVRRFKMIGFFVFRLH